jgi:hypothetical protein
MNEKKKMPMWQPVVLGGLLLVISAFALVGFIQCDQSRKDAEMRQDRFLQDTQRKREEIMQSLSAQPSASSPKR